MAIVAPMFVVCEASQALSLVITVPADVTTWSGMTFTLRGYDGQSPLVTKTLGAGITVVTGSSSTVTVALTTTDLAQTPGLYVWALERTDIAFPIVDRSGFFINPAAGTTAPRLTNLSTYLASLGFSNTVSDTDSMRYNWCLAAAEGAVSRACSRVFTFSSANTEYADATWTQTFRLSVTPVESITSLNYDPNLVYDSTTLFSNGTDYMLRPDRTTDLYSNSGLVDRAQGNVWVGDSYRPPGLITMTRIPGKRFCKVVYAGGYGNAIRPPAELLEGIFEAATIIRKANLEGRLIMSQSGEGESVSLGPLEMEIWRLASTQWAIANFRRLLF